MSEEDEGFQEPTAPGWMATFGDLMSLLLTFFVLLMSFASMDVRKYAAVAGSMRDAFGVQKLREGPIEALSTSIVELSDQDASPFVQVLPMPQRASEEEQALEARLEMTVKQVGLERMVEVEESDRGMVVRVPGELLFDEGATELKPAALVFLLELAELVKSMPHQVAIEGHTDSTPMAEPGQGSNWEISTARAVAALRFMVEVAEVDPERLRATGFADTRPLEPNYGPEERARNRRVEILFLQRGEDA